MDGGEGVSTVDNAEDDHYSHNTDKDHDKEMMSFGCETKGATFSVCSKGSKAPLLAQAKAQCQIASLPCIVVGEMVMSPDV